MDYQHIETENNQTTEDMIEEQPQGRLNQSFEKEIDEWFAFPATNTQTNTGTFHCCKSLLDEHMEATKSISSHRSIYDRNPIRFQKSDPNTLFINPSNYKAQTYQTFIPNTVTYSFEGIGSRIYNCNFNRKGDMLFTTSQSGTAIFNISNENEMKLQKTVNCSYISWALTDSDFTEDNRYMIHSTLSPNVQLFDVENQKYLSQINMDNSNEEEENNFWYYSFRIYSAKISADGKEVIGGTSRSLNGRARLQVYDITQNKLVKSINAHENDINSIAYVDKQNSSLIITGSDDGLCKLWDTRALEAVKPAAIFYGHLSGITSVESKEDNRYFISNSKDQSIKLWDLRRSTTEEKQYHHFGFDYRMEELSATEIEKIKKAMKRNPNEDSVSTFFGHQTYVTLIRCHFSPKFNTDQRYIYTGSTDGCVYIYDILTGNHVAKLSVGEGRVIRDCAWHPFNQSIVTSDFGGNICKWDYEDVLNK